MLPVLDHPRHPPRPGHRLRHPGAHRHGLVPARPLGDDNTDDPQLPMGFQLVLALILIIGLAFIPESPRHARRRHLTRADAAAHREGQGREGRRRAEQDPWPADRPPARRRGARRDPEQPCVALATRPADLPVEFERSLGKATYAECFSQCVRSGASCLLISSATTTCSTCVALSSLLILTFARGPSLESTSSESPKARSTLTASGCSSSSPFVSTSGTDADYKLGSQHRASLTA